MLPMMILLYVSNKDENFFPNSFTHFLSLVTTYFINLERHMLYYTRLCQFLFHQKCRSLSLKYLHCMVKPLERAARIYVVTFTVEEFSSKENIHIIIETFFSRFIPRRDYDMTFMTTRHTLDNRVFLNIFLYRHSIYKIVPSALCETLHVEDFNI